MTAEAEAEAAVHETGGRHASRRERSEAVGRAGGGNRGVQSPTRAHALVTRAHTTARTSGRANPSREMQNAKQNAEEEDREKSGAELRAPHGVGRPTRITATHTAAHPLLLSTSNAE